LAGKKPRKFNKVVTFYFWVYLLHLAQLLQKMNKVFFFLVVLSSLFVKGYSHSVALNKNIYISKNDSVKITIPNVFTPNNDGKNDFWSMIVTNGLEIFDLKTTIYNRNGKIVFESTNINQNWNGHNLYEGSMCSEGTYFYIISYTDGNTDETKTLKGFIELLR